MKKDLNFNNLILKFSLSKNQQQAIDQMGMTALN